jgi:predicted acylesterase/phospholipase RssA
MLFRLRTSTGAYLTHNGSSATVPIQTGANTPGENDVFALRAQGGPPESAETVWILTAPLLTRPGVLQQHRAENVLSTIDSRGRVSNRLFAVPETPNETSHLFNLVRISTENSRLQDGDRVALRLTSATTASFLSIRTGVLLIEPVPTPGPTETFTVETMSNLDLYWNSSRSDNFSTATAKGATDARAAGYQFVRTQGRVYLNNATGRKPLYLFWHGGRGDNLITATEEGERIAIAEGYVKTRLEGYVLARPVPGALPLRTYWRGAERNDFFTTTIKDEEKNAADASYEFIREEGHVAPPIQAAAPPPAPRPSRGSMPSIEGVRPIRVTPRILELIRPNLPRRRRSGNKKALVLSGGGAKGCFEVGAAKKLWEDGYRPDIICGISVGSLNGAKLAEKADTSATDLEAIWRKMHPSQGGGGSVYSKDYYVKFIGEWLRDMVVDFVDEAAKANLFDWAKYAAAHLHSIHSMQPLRDLMRQHLRVDRIRRSGVTLRIGITDLGTGQYFSVTEPLPQRATGLVGLGEVGRVEVEPDHRLGETWLSRPILGADWYAMSLQDAIYASSTMPVFMDPKFLNLANTTLVDLNGERVAMLKATRAELNATFLPRTLQRMLAAPTSGARFKPIKDAQNYELGKLFAESAGRTTGDAHGAVRHLFDGGLRDTMAIRTAIRLGAREITVVTGDRLQATSWQYKNPGTIGQDLFALPVAQYLFGLLGIWSNDSARTDVLLGVAQNEFLGWLYRCYSLLDQPAKQRILREFNEYWSTHGETLQAALGGSTWLGGDLPQDYGTPFADEGCSIRYIAPDGDLVDALGFDQWNQIEEGIERGYAAARNPVELSFPVPDTAIDAGRVASGGAS